MGRVDSAEPSGVGKCGSLPNHGQATSPPWTSLRSVSTLPIKGREDDVPIYAASFANCAASVLSLSAVVELAPPLMVIATWSK